MQKKSEFLELVTASFKAGIIKKLVFSRPDGTEAVKVSGRLCSHRGRSLLALEYSLPSGTVSQENLTEDTLTLRLTEIIGLYKQANLITTLGDAEYKVSKKGKTALLGKDAIKRRLSGDAPAFEKAIEALDKQKNYLLKGNEAFLTELGISDKNGRVHDKKQGKYRQINRFLEHIEDIYSYLPKEKTLTVYDLCCGKSYLSFAVYYYLTEVKKRSVYLLGIDLKKDVIAWCDKTKDTLGFSGMQFVCDDIKNTPSGICPDMVISLHACDVATDIVLNKAMELGAPIILSTPCCHRYMNGKVKAPELSFVTKYPHLQNKMCEAFTDAIRAARLESFGYSVSVVELTDPENTPKNTLIRAILKGGKRNTDKENDYESILKFVLGEGFQDYLSEICK